MNLIAVAIFIFFVDEVPNEVFIDRTYMKENLLMDSSEENKCKTSFVSSVSSISSSKNQEQDLKSTSCHPKEGTKIFIMRKVLETGKFIILNHNGKLLIPLTLHIGWLQAFTNGRFTKYWITCFMGKCKWKIKSFSISI